LKSVGPVAIAVALAGLLACAAGLPAVTALDADVAGVPIAELQRGRDVYVAKCSGCHRLYSPAEYDDAAWDAHVHGMRDRAKLTDGDVAAIVAYVTAMNSARSPEVARRHTAPRMSPLPGATAGG
jgi:mono/diheme cytochrome c family protein